MEYIYASLLLHAAKQQVNETNVKKVLQAAGVAPEDGRVKALIASLEGVDIDAAIKEAAIPVAAAPVQESSVAKKEAPKEEKKSEEAAAAGLAGLFD